MPVNCYNRPLTYWITRSWRIRGAGRWWAFLCAAPPVATRKKPAPVLSLSSCGGLSDSVNGGGLSLARAGRYFGEFTDLGIQEETLRAMLEASAVREVLVSRHGEKWGLAIRLGGAGSRWLPVRSRREALRTWASLTAVGRFAEGLGVKGFAVEL